MSAVDQLPPTKVCIRVTLPPASFACAVGVDLFRRQQRAIDSTVPESEAAHDTGVDVDRLIPGSLDAAVRGYGQPQGKPEIRNFVAPRVSGGIRSDRGHAPNVEALSFRTPRFSFATCLFLLKDAASTCARSFGEVPTV